MKLEQSFEVEAPVERVWAALIDLERVAPCLPGASITGHDEDGTYHGEFKVKLGPTSASYRGTVSFEETDEAAHRAVMKAKGTDKRGHGGASATIVNTLVDLGPGRTRVEAVTDYSITGRLASFGRGGMIQDISNRLLGDFATCLQGQLADRPGDAGEPAAAAAADASEAPADTQRVTPPIPGAAPEATTTAPAPRTPPPSPAPSPAKPINGLALLLGVLRERLARLFGRGRKG